MAGRFRKVSVLLFVFYVVLLCYYMFFAEDFGRGEHLVTYRYNLEPFVEIKRFVSYWRTVGLGWALINVLGNVACFVPFGFFLPIVFSSLHLKCIRVIASGYLISLFVETMQLVFRIGVFDVDDLILNTAGVIVGYSLFLMVHRIGKRVRLCQSKNESTI